MQCVCPRRPKCSWCAPHGRTQPQPSHPHWEGCQLLGLSFWVDVQQDLGCVPNALIMRRTVRSATTWWHRAHCVVCPRVGARSSIFHAHCKSGTVGTASQRALSFANRSSNFSEMYSSDPMGVPNTVIPLGCHTSGPKSSTFCGGTQPLGMSIADHPLRSILVVRTNNTTFEPKWLEPKWLRRKLYFLNDLNFWCVQSSTTCNETVHVPVL